MTIKAIFMTLDGETSVIDTPAVGVAGVDEDLLQTVVDGDGTIFRWNGAAYETADVEADEDDEGETSYDLEWTQI